MPTTIAIQRNDRREQSLRDVKDILETMGLFEEITFAVKHPEQVMRFPSAYIAAGGGPRDPADVQNFHFDHRAEVVLYVFWKEKEVGELSMELERYVVKPLLDAIDIAGQRLKTDEGYDIYVSQIETDEGTLSSTGMPVAMAVLTLTVKSPAEDAPVS